MSVGSIGSYLTNYYAGAPFEPRYRELFGRYFRALGTLEGAAWVHCTAGKDRTGILVALTQDILGVSDADIATDFLLTNEIMQVQRRIPELGPVLERLVGRVPSEAAIRCFLGVDWQHLHAMFAAIRERYHSTAKYAAECLGIDAATVHDVRSRLLESNTISRDRLGPR